mgnify:CR=1 FL=1
MLYKCSVKPHYDKIRRVKTGSGSTAIQVGYYQGKRFKLIKHIGSSKEPHKIKELEEIASEYLRSRSPQIKFNFNPQSEEILFKRGVKVAKSILETAYEYLEGIYRQIGFEEIRNNLLKHFAIIRVLEPASKVKSIALLKKYFDIEYKRTTVFRKLLGIADLKEEVERIAIKYAKNNFNFDFSPSKRFAESKKDNLCYFFKLVGGRPLFHKFIPYEHPPELF